MGIIEEKWKALFEKYCIAEQVKERMCIRDSSMKR